MFSLARQFLVHVLPAILKPMRVLWNEIIGFLFLVVGVIVTGKLVPRWREFNGEFSELVLLVFSTAFAALMCGYALFSFVRARKISRS